MKTVAIDVGNWKIKLDNKKIFDNGITFLRNKPTLEVHTGKMNGRWFKAEESRKSVNQNIIDDEYLLYLLAVALAKEDVVFDDGIHLLLGTPFTSFSSQSKKLKAFLEGLVLDYMYEGKSHRYKILKVTVCPQSFSAIVPYLNYYKDKSVLVIDIGSKTVDVIKIDDAVPIESSSITIESGTIYLLSKIKDHLMRKFSKEYPEKEIEKIFLGQNTSLPDDVEKEVNLICEEYAYELVQSLQEHGLYIEYSDLYVLGGGAFLFRNHSPIDNENVYVDENIFANVEGYMYIHQMQLNGGVSGK